MALTIALTLITLYNEPTYELTVTADPNSAIMFEWRAYINNVWSAWKQMSAYGFTDTNGVYDNTYQYITFAVPTGTPIEFKASSWPISSTTPITNSNVLSFQNNIGAVAPNLLLLVVLIGGGLAVAYYLFVRK